MTEPVQKTKAWLAAQEFLAKVDLETLQASGVWRDNENFNVTTGYPPKSIMFEMQRTGRLADDGPRVLGGRPATTKEFAGVSGQVGVYVHVPFCREMCKFCYLPHDKYQKEFQDRYVQALTKEIRLYGEISGRQPLNRLLIGGGTPSLLEPEQLEAILTTLEDTFDIAPNADVALEYHPCDDVRLLRQGMARSKLKVNRTSIGVQSFHDATAAQMNRRNRAADSIAQIARFNELGLDFNIDLIIGYPEIEGMSDLDRMALNFSTIEQLAAQGQPIPAVTLYYLWTIYRTPLTQLIDSGRLALQSAMAGLDSRAYGHFRMLELGYSGDDAPWYRKQVGARNCATRNESGFSGYDSQPAGTLAAFGLGAYGYVNNITYHNHMDFPAYYECLENNDELPVKCALKLSEEAARRRHMVLHFKDGEGIARADYQVGASPEFRREIEARLDRLQELGCVEQVGDRVRMTTLGRMFCDELTQQFYPIEILQKYRKTSVASATPASAGDGSSVFVPFRKDKEWTWSTTVGSARTAAKAEAPSGSPEAKTDAPVPTE